jgi:hypothetical protein
LLGMSARRRNGLNHEHGGHESHSAVPARTATTRKAAEKWPLNWTAPPKADAVERECARRSMPDGGLRPELAPFGRKAGQLTAGPWNHSKQRWCDRSVISARTRPSTLGSTLSIKISASQRRITRSVGIHEQQTKSTCG